MHRLEEIVKHSSNSSSEDIKNNISLNTNLQRLASSSPSDVVICCATRSPITKAVKGGLSTLFPEDLLKQLFEDMIKRTGVNPKLIDDVCIGNVLQPGAGLVSSRISTLLAGLPETVPIHTVNRLCSSGLQAVATIASSIKAGYIRIGLAGGVESMSHYDMMRLVDPGILSDEVFHHNKARNCLLSMGLTAENVAEKYKINRITQDKFSEWSHQKALNAQENNLFSEEIVPIILKDTTVISQDDGIRKNTSIIGLSQLKPAFKQNGTVTAGNSSQISDGAALCLLANRETAETLGLPILATFIAFSVVGVPPDLMGIGPAFAIPLVLKQAHLSKEDIDIFEINEAFASQASYCANHLEIPLHKLNPKGGAIALGHPLGATGARQIATLLPELRRQKKRFGIVSMCVGTGMGAAAIIENLHI